MNASTPAGSPSSIPSTPNSGSSGLCVATLVLGIIGMIACPVLGLVGVITGVLALRRRPHQSPLDPPAKSMAIIGLVCSLVGVLIIGPFVGMYFYSRTVELNRRLLCAGQLNAIRNALLIYESQNENAGLPVVEDLVVQGLLTRTDVTCPSAKSNGPHYLIANLPTRVAANSLVLVHEPFENHNGGTNVLFNDGHVTFMNARQFLDREKSPSIPP